MLIYPFELWGQLHETWINTTGYFVCVKKKVEPTYNFKATSFSRYLSYLNLFFVEDSQHFVL